MNRPLWGWLTAEAVSLMGTRISLIAIPWFVLAKTNSPMLTGLVALAETLPLLLLKVLAGPAIDRIGSRVIAILCDIGSALTVGLVPLLHVIGVLPLWLLLVIVALAGILRGPGDAAKRALIPVLARHSGTPMERVTGLHSTVERSASFLGAALGGGLVALVGAANALVIDAASFGLSAIALAWGTAGMMRSRSQSNDERHGYFRRLREGWHFLRRDRVLLAVTLMIASTNLLDAAYTTVLMPVWADRSGNGPAALGIAFATFTGTAILGSVSASAAADRLSRYATYLAAFLIAGLPRFMVFGLDTPSWLHLSVLGCSGFAAGFINPVLGAVIFERIPEDLTGRVSALTSAISFALIPFGGILGGVLINWFGFATAMIGCGVAYLVVTLLPAAGTSLRQLDDRHTSETRQQVRS